MRKLFMFTGVVMMFSLLTLGAGAQLSGIQPPPWVADMPECEPMPWEDGQFVTYRMDVEIEEENVGCDMRIAIVGSETSGGEDYYWLELDLDNVSDLPEDLGLDGEFNSFSLQVLMAEYDMTAAEEDPEAFLSDLLSMEMLKRVIYQMNDEQPVEIDLSFLVAMAPMLEMSMEAELEGYEEEYGEEVEGVWDQFDWGFDTQDVSTSAGSFKDAIKFWFSFDMEEEDAVGSFSVFMHESIPLGCLLKVIGSVEAASEEGAVNISVELIDTGDDAGSRIVGEPILINPMADMMGMGEMNWDE